MSALERPIRAVSSQSTRSTASEQSNRSTVSNLSTRSTASTRSEVSRTATRTATAPARSYARTVTGIEGNGNTTQWGISIRDTVFIRNEVQIGDYLAPREEKEEYVQYFTNRFVVVSIAYRRNQRGGPSYKLVKREPHNVRLVRKAA